MALTAFQRDVCRALAERRKAAGESYVAGGAALNTLLGGTRISRDVDLFHDTVAALGATFEQDRATLLATGFTLVLLRERPAFVEAEVRRGTDSVLLQWVHESAFRFFPLVEDEAFGLALHPFDLATNKVLALVGRVEPRDWIDTLTCCERVQPLGYLAWAACGKDPGYSPLAILEQAARTTHYAAEELRGLAFEGEPPDPAALSRRWQAELEEARRVVRALPSEQAGSCVLAEDGKLARLAADALKGALRRGEIRFHAGSIRGAMPSLKR
jgi:hypothetical protein